MQQISARPQTLAHRLGSGWAHLHPALRGLLADGLLPLALLVLGTLWISGPVATHPGLVTSRKLFSLQPIDYGATVWFSDWVAQALGSGAGILEPSGGCHPTRTTLGTNFPNWLDAILAADILRDQSRIALGGSSKVVRIYSTSDGEPAAEIRKHTDWIRAVEFSPDVAEGQEVRLFLDERTATAGGRYVLTPEAPAGGFPATTLKFKFADLKRTTYLMRCQVDGTDSAPDVDADPTSPSYLQISGPEVSMP